MQEVSAEANNASTSGEKANGATKTALACVVKFGFLAKEIKLENCRNSEAIEEIFGKSNDFELSIPYYQRPYVWGEKEVNILLKDIESQLEDKKQYLLGSLILCENAESKNGGKTLEIVDGQQRLTTLALILHALDENKEKYADDEKKKLFLGHSNFEHNDSKINIKQNYLFIEKYFETYKSKVQSFKDFLLKNIEFVCVLAPSLDDVFIFFDSANAKGKKLESYDLIKAFHLRALQKDDIKNKAESFEKLAKKDEGKYIHTLLNEILAPTRVWLRDSKITKTASEINVYDEFCQEYFDNGRENLKRSAINLGILQSFASGEDFFKYLQIFHIFYEKIKRQLQKMAKNENKDSEAKTKYEWLLNYDRGGFAYTQYVFFMSMMIFCDKFCRNDKGEYDKYKGNDEFFALLIMRASFDIIIDTSSIHRATARNHAKKLLPKL